MAMQPPTQGPPGLGPARPPLSVVPGGAPPGMPPGGPPPPMGGPPMAPPQPPPPPSPGGLGPAAPFSGLLSDLPAHLGTGWQSVDIAIRALKTALRSTDFQKLPSVVAVIQSNLNTMTKLLSSYTSGTQGAASTAPSSASPSSSDADAASTTAADADSMPAAPSSDET